MQEPLVVGLVLAAFIAGALLARLTAGEPHSRSLSRLEAKIDAILKHDLIAFDPYAGVPPAVVDALRRGRKIEAIKAYRTATGTGLKEAKEFVEDVQRRGDVRPGR
jgi:hypothetical protein